MKNNLFINNPDFQVGEYNRPKFRALAQALTARTMGTVNSSSTGFKSTDSPENSWLLNKNIDVHCK